ncbi:MULTISPECIES: non-ribosomal peptide synthetase [unclassified Rhizobium]|uniref:non-ribosomal peptide synthetase n=1 Tax=unclassified Rhizobium TaxID=2613769 RepID=UPI001ADD1A5F|nr:MULTISPECIES: non-ribosomal peptide synthetase [unclassified Rhizobium]MBO9101943.1 amino acid adenylation domain-containing protein [Rhizobium sp. L58/93]MBO9172114.1 amino acid adenylation domain-containing protein [Rhizobium sp. L245/93]QXZ88329.1 amino acid adenylation domain-containing protein [Rhizobium sp. K1/93]QXZ94300.1 amino acid adenylation domain-containing protein [Rhizobium sp. K15/93]QYA05611.1 amino acid adenylation domain-containing protein [Rhizobium sp. B21/90]
MNSRIELLHRRLEQNGVKRTAIRKRPNADVAPLSDAQHRMWLHQKLHPASGAYNVCIRIDLAGALDVSRLLAALAAVVDHHEILRTTYPTDAKGQPYQRIHAQLSPEVHIVEHGDPERVARDRACAPFDIASSGPLRAHLVKIDAARWSLVLTVHHIVWDGGCFGIFSRDLSLAYRGLAIEPLSIQYADITAHRSSPNSDADLEAQLSYWRETLTPLPPALPLPTIQSSGPRTSERASRLDRVMPTDCATGLRAAAASLKTTPFAVFIAAYALLLHRWTGASDITIGTTVANRHEPGSGALIGNFGNTVLLRLEVSADATFRQLVAQTARVVTDAVSHGDVSFERIVSALAPVREAGHGYFTDTLGLFLDRDIGGPYLPEVEVRWSNVFNGSSPFALTFQGFLTGDALEVEATFRSELFATATVLDMLDHLESILLAATADPAQPCSTVSHLPAPQRDRLLRLSRGAEIDRNPVSVLDHWRRQVKSKPSRIALVSGPDRFRFFEIDEQANRLAAHLMARGIRAQDVVAVAASRGLITVVAPLAIWKCGAIFLPLDPRHPEARLQKLVRSANAKLLICDFDVAIDNLPVVSIDAVMAAATEPAIDPGHSPHRLEAAHIGFTSGSTGQPKGVVTTHGSLAARTVWVSDHWRGGVGGTRLAKSAPTAIDATAELCEAFVTGECIVLATDDEARDAAALARLLKTHGIGHFMAVPGLIGAVAIAAPDVMSDMDRVLSTGEPLLPGVAASIYRTAESVPLYNSYGCTETTGDVTAGRISSKDAANGVISIGRPLPGSCCYVLTADLTLSPPGALGELYVEGQQLARGYLAQPALTATRFIASPFAGHDRLYRTGDLARWREDGRLELAGRVDDQVNIRGYRVEPDETVAELYAAPDVKEAAILPRRIGSTMELVAYVSGDGLRPQDGPRLRARLADRLPGPLVPAEVVVLPSLPRLEGGKIDRQALPRGVVAPDVSSRSPRDDREKNLTRILAELLGCGSVGIDDNFFTLGGDSLMALSFAACANAAGFEFPAAAVFQYPTVAQLVEQLPPLVEEQAKPISLPAQVHRFRLSGLPLSEFVTWEPLRGPAKPDRLRAALAEAISSHPTLQQGIAVRGRLWRATRMAGDGRDAKVIEIASSDPARVIEAARSAIDIAAGAVIAVVLTPDAALLVAHAAAIDGLSLRRIADDIYIHLAAEHMMPTRADHASGRGQAAMHPFAPVPATIHHDWQSIIDLGPKCPWWVGPDEILSKGPDVRVRAAMDLAAETLHMHALLSAALDVSKGDLVVADVEVEPDGIGPLLAAPVLARAGARDAPGDGGLYIAFIDRRRPVAGGPGLLVRRTVTPRSWPDAGMVRGTDRLYRIVASWQEIEGQTELEIAAGDADMARALLNAWIAAISRQDSDRA